TAQLGITAASLGLGMYGEHVVAGWIESGLDALASAYWAVPHTLASVLAVGGLTYLHIVIGEMVPKSLALQWAERTALWITPPMLAVRSVLSPLVLTLNGLGNVLLAAIGVRRHVAARETYYTPEELQIVVQESQEAGAISTEASRLLSDVFEFGERTAGEVMAPRVAVTGIAVGMAPAEIGEVLRQAPHTRYPVYEENLDQIVGVINVKDLLRAVVSGTAVRREDARPVPIVPETAALDVVLAVMRRERSHMVVVVDEFGGVAGVATLEDLFDEVVGEIPDSAGEVAPLRGHPEGVVVARGTVRLDEVGECFGLALDHEDVDSVSGLVLTMLGRPPRIGDAVTYRGLAFEVLSVAGLGVRECAIHRVAPAADDPDS
ncbi:MAG TPA: hemolysin family protein, partial [Methylomirabilota bacterium]